MLGHFNKCIGKYDMNMKYEKLFACDKKMLIQWDVQDSVLYVFQEKIEMTAARIQ